MNKSIGNRYKIFFVSHYFIIDHFLAGYLRTVEYLMAQKTPCPHSSQILLSVRRPVWRRSLRDVSLQLVMIPYLIPLFKCLSKTDRIQQDFYLGKNFFQRSKKLLQNALKLFLLIVPTFIEEECLQESCFINSFQVIQPHI